MTFQNDDEEVHLPTALWVEAECAKLNVRGQGYYITQRGNHYSGVILVKVFNRLEHTCTAYIQQRDLDNKLGWDSVLGEGAFGESDIDQYIRSACEMDPDLWVIEVEDRQGRHFLGDQIVA